MLAMTFKFMMNMGGAVLRELAVAFLPRTREVPGSDRGQKTNYHDLIYFKSFMKHLLKNG
jgi:hypothetical protein